MWTRDRDEVDTLSVDLLAAGWLEAGETISTLVVVVRRRVGTGWLDVTASFVDTPPPSFAGSVVTWKKKAGSAITQPGKGTYAVRLTVTTNTGRTIVRKEDLMIDDKAAI